MIQKTLIAEIDKLNVLAPEIIDIFPPFDLDFTKSWTDGCVKKIVDSIKKAIETRTTLPLTQVKCLYAFEIVQSPSPTLLTAIGNQYTVDKAGLLNIRRFHKIEKKWNEPSRLRTSYLYVGKVAVTPIYTRIKQHLGFGPAMTAALQLNHWAPKLKLKLKLHIAILPDTTTSFQVLALEAALANGLNPLVGERS